MSEENKNKGNLPRDYFENFENRLRSKIEGLDDKISEDAPLLHAIGKEENYLVPEDYFEHFKLRKKARKPVVVSIMRYSIGIAASFLLLFSLYTQFPGVESTPDLLAAVEDEALYDYLIQNAGSINEELLLDFTEASAFNDEELSELDFLLDNISEIELDDLQDL